MASTPDDGRVTITDIRVLAALAHPVRLSILQLLMGSGERTATECAEVVDATPSSCSYHLRHLETFGLVERSAAAKGVDGRTRRWTASSAGFHFGGSAKDRTPAETAAGQALATTGLEENLRLALHYLSHSDSLDHRLQDAAMFSSYTLMLSVEELENLGRELDALIRPFLSAGRVDAPRDAVTVRMAIDAFARTDL
ncbi:MAG: helix-turn-helix domain-containing protein [Acidimicrobiales bacterium]